MKTPRSRSLDAWDASILVTATIAAMGIAYALSPIPSPGVVAASDLAIGAITGEPAPPPEVPRSGVLERANQIARPFLMVWTPAIAIVGLRRPRPPWRRLFRQPGMAACVLATAVLVGLFVGYGLRWAWAASGTGTISIPPVPTVSPVAPIFIGTTLPLEVGPTLGSIVSDAAYTGDAIAGAWLIMALGGWWRPERSGIDRLGRALGAAWIALMVVGFVAGLMQ